MDKQQSQKKKKKKISNKPADESRCGHILYRKIAHYKFIINVPQTLYAAFINWTEHWVKNQEMLPADPAQPWKEYVSLGKLRPLSERISFL